MLQLPLFFFFCRSFNTSGVGGGHGGASEAASKEEVKKKAPQFFGQVLDSDSDGTISSSPRSAQVQVFLFLLVGCDTPLLRTGSIRSIISLE
jgi:hypothetical protein